MSHLTIWHFGLPAIMSAHLWLHLSELDGNQLEDWTRATIWWLKFAQPRQVLVKKHINTISETQNLAFIRVKDHICNTSSVTYCFVFVFYFFVVINQQNLRLKKEINMCFRRVHPYNSLVKCGLWPCQANALGQARTHTRAHTHSRRAQTCPARWCNLTLHAATANSRKDLFLWPSSCSGTLRAPGGRWTCPKSSKTG